MTLFSFRRFFAVLAKEFIQMRRDRLTFGMMMGVPLMQLLLFGYAINTDPKNLPAVAVVAENSNFTRSLLRAMENTGYIRFVSAPVDDATSDRMLRRGEVQFAVHIPVNFAEDIVRGRKPALLVEADATDPVATGNALSALQGLDSAALIHDLKGPLQALQNGEAPFEVQLHKRYNAEGITQYNIVPGLMGVVLTMTMVMMTSLAVTRERERGTMENLLAMPVQPMEVMLGKILPYIVVGYVQVAIIVVAARYLFSVPLVGSLPLLSLAAIIFIAANLAVGFTFSTLSTNQLQAMQMSVFFFLPSLLLSGFMFPFRGMPAWAQILGEALPLTHFLRIVRGILLKGNGWADIWPDLWPILTFLVAAAILALIRYRRTLD
ncbi:ABC transporter permease [Ferrovibrio sp.]|uniref:ABC transporter permease n=1 Tax=Ferrovibrio sp. TaxID=1917215 RepID=UPI0035AE53E8